MAKAVHPIGQQASLGQRYANHLRQGQHGVQKKWPRERPLSEVYIRDGIGPGRPDYKLELFDNVERGKIRGGREVVPDSALLLAKISRIDKVRILDIRGNRRAGIGDGDDPVLGGRRQILRMERSIQRWYKRTPTGQARIREINVCTGCAGS